LKTRDVTATVMALLRDGVARLEASGLPTARHDAERLLAGLTGTTRLALYLERDRGVQPETLRKYLALVERRAGHEPLQYLLGEDEFTGLDLRVRPGVFIPRPETELLVERVLASLPPVSETPRTAADLGTGTGCIALALCHARPDLMVIGVDSSPPAVVLARENAERLGFTGRVEIREGDLFEPIRDLVGRLDVVVSNPPYIARELLDELPAEVRDHEPTLALDGGPGGTAFHERIIRAAPAFLRPGGLLALELGAGQAERLGILIRQTAAFTEVTVVADLLGIERVLTARRR